MIHILFVCLGNICRSPMAEAMFRDLVIREGLENEIIIDSAGTGNWHEGKPPHQGTRDILAKNNIDYEGLTARQISKEDLDKFHYIITMDSENLKNVQMMVTSNHKVVVAKLLSYVQKDNIKDVPDPYFTGNFEEVYDLLKEGCQELLKVIKKEHAI